MVWKRLIRHRPAMTGAIILLVVLIAAVFAPFLAPYSPTKQSFVDQLQPPSAAHWFGTDEFGRDIFSRVLYGARIALVVGFIADGIALVLGVAVGMVAGFLGGRWDSLLMRATDVLLAFPYLLLALMIMAVLGPGLSKAMVAIGIVYTPHYARVVRGSVLSLREQEFVQASKAAGSSTTWQMLRHVIPNVMAPIIVQATLLFGSAIVETSALGFLGLGAPPGEPEWGAMLANGRVYMLTAPWLALFPGLAIFVTVVGLNLLGDGLRDVLDPKMTR